MEQGPKRVLLTASGDEVSKGIAYHLVKCGCRLVLMGDEESLRSMSKEISGSLKVAAPIEVVGVDMEAEEEAVFGKAVDEAWKRLGALDAFVNTYLFEGKIQELFLVSQDEVKKMMKINVLAPWFLLKAISTRMRDSKVGGSIVFLTTIIGGERGIYPRSAVYGTCMSAVEQLIRTSALELGKYNIRVNGIFRGLHLGDKYPQSAGRDVAQKLTKEVMPLHRWLDPKKDLASTVIYLVSDESSYMTGTTIYVDGAQSIVRPRMSRLHSSM